MILSEEAKSSITTKAKNRLALELDCSVYTVDRWIKENAENGDLTKAKAVEIIAEESGIPADEILVAVTEPQS